MAFHGKLAQRPVIVPLVLQCPPTECPCHAAARPALFEGVAELAGRLRRVQLRLVIADELVAPGFNLVDADDGVEGQEPVARQRQGRRPGVFRPYRA